MRIRATLGFYFQPPVGGLYMSFYYFANPTSEAWVYTVIFIFLFPERGALTSVYIIF